MSADKCEDNPNLTLTPYMTLSIQINVTYSHKKLRILDILLIRNPVIIHAF